MKRYIVFFLVLTISSLVYYYGFYKKESAQDTNTQIANPSAVYCQEQGGTSKTLDFDLGQKSFCYFPDGSECEEWAFYHGECQKGSLIKEVLQPGQGKLADVGDTISVYYTGTLLDGTIFDSNAGGTPFSLTLGNNDVIQGWEQGLIGMQVGEKRKLTIAPALAYVDRAVGGVIPSNSTLVFEVELLEIK